jgi:hypothetical protein
VPTFFIPGPLPGQNEMIAAAKSGRGRAVAYSRMKRAWTDAVALHARAARLPHMDRIRLDCRWLEARRNRDPDNIAAAKKFVLDGLVVAGVLDGDGWAQVAAFSDTWDTAGRVGVVVTITPV